MWWVTYFNILNASILLLLLRLSSGWKFLWHSVFLIVEKKVCLDSETVYMGFRHVDGPGVRRIFIEVGRHDFEDRIWEIVCGGNHK